jgi:hypothetical protein
VMGSPFSCREINTINNAKCFIWNMMTKVAEKGSFLKQIILKLPSNDSYGFAFIHPHVSSIGPALNVWDIPVKTIRIENNRYLEIELHLRKHACATSNSKNAMQ